MDSGKTIACVTGASGMIGQRIVRQLIEQGFKVRVLSRRENFNDQRVDHFKGGLKDEETLRTFVFGADLLFHCAGEVYDESIMWDVNVLGTERLILIVSNSSIRHFCYLSSAGVVGRTDIKWVDEETKCKPQSVYEQSKWAAEQLGAKGIDGCQVVLLRPVNVIDEKRPGALGMAINDSWLNRFKFFLKGGECAHIVHAEDVADAAMYLTSRQFKEPRCFFVSCDHDSLNTFAGLWALCRVVENNRPLDNVRPAPHLPLIVPHMLRSLYRGKSNRGDVRYSSKKLISEGFNYRLGVKGATKQIISQLITQ